MRKYRLDRPHIGWKRHISRWTFLQWWQLRHHRIPQKKLPFHRNAIVYYLNYHYLCNRKSHGVLRSPVARLLWEQEVARSNRVTRTIRTGKRLFLAVPVRFCSLGKSKHLLLSAREENNANSEHSLAANRTLWHIGRESGKRNCFLPEGKGYGRRYRAVPRDVEQRL